MPGAGRRCSLVETRPSGQLEQIEGRTTVTVTEAAKLLGIGRTAAYEAARRGELPRPSARERPEPGHAYSYGLRLRPVACSYRQWPYSVCLKPAGPGSSSA
jgi:hypothetical protein